MKLITLQQARALDVMATRKLGLLPLVMMENAGIAIADFTLQVLRQRKKKKVAVFCGRGNNAGDGFVASRQLICRGVCVDTFLLSSTVSLRDEARINYEILRKMDGRTFKIRNRKDINQINLSGYGVLIDAILGIGLKGEVSGLFRNAIEKINSSGKIVIAIDTPSGLDADTGEILGVAIKADYTLSFAAAKRGFFKRSGPNLCGRIIIKHIGFPYLGNS